MISADSKVILRARGLSKTYVQGRWWEKQSAIKALDGVDLSLKRGETLAILGPSGSGKTTLAMCLSLLLKPEAGSICFDGLDVFSLTNAQLRMLRPKIQIVFQDSATGLPARFSARQIVEEPLLIQGGCSGRERAKTALALMDKVGLSRRWADRLPSELSGGQRQRLAIARAISLRPSVLVLDEPFVGLDVSIRGQIVNLLLELQAEYSLAYLYVSHDVEVVRYLGESIVLLRDGKLVCASQSTELFPVAANETAL